jgi:hypothetical protein
MRVKMLAAEKPPEEENEVMFCKALKNDAKTFVE